MRRSRLALIGLATLATACLSDLAGPDPSATSRSLFDLIWNDFDRNYASFILKNVDWDDVYRRYKPRVDSTTTANQLIPILRAMFSELRDPHVDLATPLTLVTSIDWSRRHTYFSSATVFTGYLPGRKVTPSSNMVYGTIAPGVGYIWIGSFGGRDWDGEIDRVLETIGTAPAIIIDIRNNGGGSSGTSDALASRFVDAKHTYGFVRYRNGPAHDDFDDYVKRDIEPTGHVFNGKLAVLTNRLSVSAAELFVLALKSRGQLLLIGDTTAGGLAHPLSRELPNGWTYRIPQWIQYGPNKEIYEGIGLAPSVYVPLTASDSVSRRDVQLERAIALMRP